MIQQIKSYKTLDVKQDVEHVVGVQDKVKQKEVGIRINEPKKPIQIDHGVPNYGLKWQ
ncbi:hypothetical protein [Enterobacter hormaechei]|uniref:hypothetical protein n=1 Tax=Enterobacter hormaechei TaxID=158836 RepID=UPI0023E465EF|nr:hypothetical protein [Enterobacter hormaechei]MDF3686329.1 hypothetical protein [Enterobacter hormaechei]